MHVRNKSLLSILMIISYRFHKEAISVHIRFYKISNVLSNNTVNWIVTS